MALVLAWTLRIPSCAAQDTASAPKGLPSKDRPEMHKVELRGTIVRLPDASKPIGHADLKAHPERIWGFKSTDGTVYRLVRTRFSEALLVDPRLRKMELVVRGTVGPGGRILEVDRTLSIRDGILYDLYYDCSVCNIETVSPGPCECCQRPVQLVEKPIGPYRPGMRLRDR